jgi:hypothetical protein
MLKVNSNDGCVLIDRFSKRTSLNFRIDWRNRKPILSGESDFVKVGFDERSDGSKIFLAEMKDPNKHTKCYMRWLT